MARASDPDLARQVATGIVRRLREAGHTAYFAGGCVRDALLGQHPTDFDVATDATPAVVKSLFRSTDEVGAAFGVVLVHERAAAGSPGQGRVTVEVATFRSDGPYSDARRPDSVRFSDPRSDAARRDFTINALFLDPLAPPGPSDPPGAGGRIIDFVSGVADLRARTLRAVGDPERRLAEDHLRALRAVRFAARLGFAIEPATSGAIRRHAAELRGVSRERIGDELRRMLVHPSRARALELLQELTLDEPVLNEPTRGAALATVRGLAGEVSATLALAAWTLDRAGVAGGAGLDEAAAGAARKRLRAALCLSNDECDEWLGLVRGHRLVGSEWAGATVARRKRWASSPWFEGSLRLLDATQGDRAREVREAASAMAGDGVGLAPDPLVTGDDLTGAGLKPGPAFRRILESVYDAQLEGRVRTRAEAMELAGRLNV